jgi:nicotinamidase-related amidase
MMQDMSAQLLDAARSQLVLVDHQQRLMPAIAGGERVLARALRLARLAQVLAVPCLATEQSPDKLGPVEAPLRALCSQVLAKSHFDACADGLLEPAQAAARAGRDQLVVAGCEAHVCLLQTVLGLHAAGLRTWVVADACGSRDPLDRELALRRLEGAGAVIVSSEMVGFEWVRHAGHPEFRALQALVR